MTMKKQSRKQIDINLAVYDEQDKMFRALFRALAPGRRWRIAMRELRLAAEAAGRPDKEVLRELRSEMKLIAKWKAEDKQKLSSGAGQL